MQLTFFVIPNNTCFPETGKSQVYLRIDNWNDYSYKTLYEIVLFDEKGNKRELGYVKIANFGQTTEERIELPKQFEFLDERFFSLGQSDHYYSTLMTLERQLREKFLRNINDIVFNEELLKKALDEDVTTTSLLRDTSLTTIKGQYRRILNDGAILTRYNFAYETKQTNNEAGYRLEFKVEPESNPPTNIHVLIGRNGVGKTHLLNNIVKTLIKEPSNKGRFDYISDKQNEGYFFSRVVSVSYSAFDPFKPYIKTEGLRYEYIGLKEIRKDNITSLKNRDQLTIEFVKSFEHCFHVGKKDRLKKAISSLNSDPLFEELEITLLLEQNWDENKIKYIFDRLSSGHAIVLLTITKLVETLEEKTLLLLDEPEGHLHPPLLSAFIRTLSDILKDRNAVAIVATHSPVIVQEVPRSCVWKLSRFGLEAKAERVDTETFGENIGTLTREIFGLEVSKSGFHKLLKDDVENGLTYEQIIQKYSNQLGFEARLLLRALLSDKDIF
ncbi:AAA family ATPase [Hydrogenimonas thermophila]|uniref:AAA domain-containing protein, putative AbiEii toxin, Type IV TA system n=1 Tax=Hydrogenimonas thermophila TaxID=223786 RepID=A0A1I5KPC3_9BACT|nr:AAA family ATPase [Hydrogenimonas thermophila]SFO86683.1 AAA domain-containing protein, putative AbiEii toxin, Type IV TA system [Hydrogenimonas thermophila]